MSKGKLERFIKESVNTQIGECKNFEYNCFALEELANEIKSKKCKTIPVLQNKYANLYI